MESPKILKAAITKAGPTVARTLFLAKKHLPEIMVVGGTASVIGGAALACKATLKASKIAEIQIEAENEEDTKTFATKKGVEIAVGYLPAVGMIGGGLALLIGAKSIEHRRFTAALGMYSSLQSAFGEYRQRVVEEQGEDADLRYFNGTEIVSVETIEDKGDGKKPKKTKTEVTVFTGGENPLHRIFDECNAPGVWKENLNDNLFFLKCQEKVFNQRLAAHKRIFLNDVYKELGFEYHEAGQFIGWLADDIEGSGDGFISFGIDKAALDREVARAQESNCVPEPSIWLTFNCDGEVWDKPLRKKYDI